jgi:hypothetical protein
MSNVNKNEQKWTRGEWSEKRDIVLFEMLADKELEKKGGGKRREKITWKKILDKVNEMDKNLGNLSESAVKKRKQTMIDGYKAKERVDRASSGTNEAYTELDRTIARYLAIVSVDNIVINYKFNF